MEQDVVITLPAAISRGFDYLLGAGQDIPAGVWAKATSLGVFKADGPDLSAINAKYHDVITASLLDYLDGGNLRVDRNAFTRATVEAFGAAFDGGWAAGGGEPPPDGDAAAWLNTRVEQEVTFIQALFEQAKELKKDPEFDRLPWVSERADGFVRSVTAVFNAGKMLAMKNQMLEWRYGDTEHCPTCQGLNGKKHRASWYLSRDYIPGKPGAALACGGYRCQCSLWDKNGNQVTI